MCRRVGAETDVIDLWLREQLRGGEVPVADLAWQLWSYDQLRRASERLGVVKRKDGIAGGWLWSLR